MRIRAWLSSPRARAWVRSVGLRRAAELWKYIQVKACAHTSDGGTGQFPVALFLDQKVDYRQILGDFARPNHGTMEPGDNRNNAVT